MTKNVIKRDGSLVQFEFKKIKDAVDKAFQAVYQCDAPDDFINYLEAASLTFEDEMSVEDIQKFVIYSLGEFKYYDVQIAYTEYRYKHKIHRENNEKLLAQIQEKLEATNIENQNANLDERSFGGRIGEASRVVTKDYALNYCMSEMAKNNHLNNEIYIHDLDSYAVGMHNCLSIPFDDLLANGFNTRQTDVRPAGSVNTAFQLVAVIFQLQSLQQFGGVSATHID
jgi:ribonucleoside-triphosphate reductase